MQFPCFPEVENLNYTLLIKLCIWWHSDAIITTRPRLKYTQQIKIKYNKNNNNNDNNNKQQEQHTHLANAMKQRNIYNVSHNSSAATIQFSTITES